MLPEVGHTPRPIGVIHDQHLPEVIHGLERPAQLPDLPHPGVHLPPGLPEPIAQANRSTEEVIRSLLLQAKLRLQLLLGLYAQGLHVLYLPLNPTKEILVLDTVSLGKSTTRPKIRVAQK